VSRAILVTACVLGFVSTSARASEPIVLETAEPFIVAEVSFQSGSAHDPPGKEGLAYVTARWLAEGGTQSLTNAEVLRRFFPHAAEWSVRVERERTLFVFRAPKVGFAALWPLVVEIVTKPGLRETDFARLKDDARSQVVNALRQDNDEELGKELLQSLLYEGHPYGHPVAGRASTVARLTAEDVAIFRRDHVRGDTADIAIGGGLTKGEALAFAAMMQDALPMSRVRAGRLRLPPVALPSAPRAVIIDKAGGSTAVSMGFPIEVTRRHPDFVALLVAGSALGEHRTFNGRLMQRLRGVRGLNYGDYAYVEHFVQDGWSVFPQPVVSRAQQYFSIWLRPVKNANADFATRAALWEFERFVREGITQAELDDTRRFLAGYSKMWVQTTARRLGYRLDDRTYGTGDLIADLPARLDTLTLADVNAAIRRHLGRKAPVIAVVSPEARALAETWARKDATAKMTYEQGSKTPDDVLAEDKKIGAHMLGLDASRIEVRALSSVFE